MKRHAARAALPFLLLGLAFVGCDSGRKLGAPDLAVARLVGHVLTGSDPSAWRVEARGVDLPLGLARIIAGHPAADGAFALDVPPGRYLLRLDNPGIPGHYYAASGPVTGSSQADTLEVAEGRILAGLDFRLGSARLEISVADPGLEGVRATLKFYRQAADGQGREGSPRTTEQLITGGTATLTLEGLPPGLYQAELVLGTPSHLAPVGRGGEHIWLPDSDGPEGADWYEITAGAMLPLAYASTAEAAHLSGRIDGAWLELGLDDRPLLDAIDTDSVLVLEGWPVDEAGAFTLDLLRPRPVRILIRQNTMAHYLGGPDFATATVYDPQPGQTITGVDEADCALTLDTGLETVYWQPVFEVLTADGLTSLGQIHRDPVGDLFVVPNLWPGTFLLRILSPYHGLAPWLDQWYPGTLDVDLATPITLTDPGQILPLAMTLLEGGSISGRLVEKYILVPYPHVVVTTADDPSVWGTANPHGIEQEYEVLGLPDGDYRLGQTLAYATSDTIWYPGTTDWTEAAVITITDGADVAGIDIPVE